MDPAGVSLFAFLCFMAAALAGMWLGRALPDTVFTDRNSVLIREARRLVVGLSTLTLGLIIAAATTSFETRKNEIEASASKVIALDSTLAKIGPKAREEREILRSMLQRGIERLEIAAVDGFGTERTRAGIGVNRLQLRLFELTPENERETWLRGSALSLAGELASARWLQYSAGEGNIQFSFLATMIFWLAVVFLSYGIVAPRNQVSFWTMFVVALCLSMAISLTLDLDTPNRGLIQISGHPLRLALEQIGPLP